VGLRMVSTEWCQQNRYNRIVSKGFKAPLEGEKGKFGELDVPAARTPSYAGPPDAAMSAWRSRNSVEKSVEWREG
jgi:hypothetical protein